MTLVLCQQLAPRIADLPANRERSVRAIAEAVDAGADVVVLPELVTSGYVFHSTEEAAAKEESMANQALPTRISATRSRPTTFTCASSSPTSSGNTSSPPGASSIARCCRRSTSTGRPPSYRGR